MRRLKNRCTWHCAWFHLKQNIISGGAPSRFHASKLRMDVWYTGGHPNASFESPLGQSMSNFPRNRQLLLAPRWYEVFQYFDIRTLLLSQMKVFRELGALLGPIFKRILARLYNVYQRAAICGNPLLEPYFALEIVMIIRIAFASVNIVWYRVSQN